MRDGPRCPFYGVPYPNTRLWTFLWCSPVIVLWVVSGFWVHPFSLLWLASLVAYWVICFFIVKAVSNVMWARWRRKYPTPTSVFLVIPPAFTEHYAERVRNAPLN